MGEDNPQTICLYSAEFSSDLNKKIRFIRSLTRIHSLFRAQRSGGVGAVRLCKVAAFSESLCVIPGEPEFSRLPMAILYVSNSRTPRAQVSSCCLALGCPSRKRALDRAAAMGRKMRFG